MGFSEQRQPTETAGWTGTDQDLWAGSISVLSCCTSKQPEVVKLGHQTNPDEPALAMERDLPTHQM